MNEKLNALLKTVSKPGRYSGGEYGQIVKDKRKVNQAFVQIPLSRFKDKLVFKCRQKGIKIVVINESYTSKSSFYDNDLITKGKYSGTRISRGLYQTKDKRI